MKRTLICLDTLVIAVPLIIGSAVVMPYAAYCFARELARERYENRD